MTDIATTALRPLARADAAVIQRIYSPYAVRFLRRPAMTHQRQAEQWLHLAMMLQQVVPWQRITWGITCGPDLIGIIRLDRRTFGAGRRQTAALSYILSEDNWGQGHATRAASAVIDRAFASLGLTVIRARHHPDNTISGKVLTNLGFSRTSASDETEWLEIPYRDESLVTQLRRHRHEGTPGTLGPGAGRDRHRDVTLGRNRPVLPVCSSPMCSITASCHLLTGRRSPTGAAAWCGRPRGSVARRRSSSATTRGPTVRSRGGHRYDSDGARPSPR